MRKGWDELKLKAVAFPSVPVGGASPLKMQ